jgi:hypothetical protein
MGDGTVYVFEMFVINECTHVEVEYRLSRDWRQNMKTLN